MDILLTVATVLESQLILSSFDFEEAEDAFVAYTDHGKIFLLPTGIGMVSTAYMLGRFLAKTEIDLGINFGIAGSFDKNIPLGEVVEITQDSFAELGAEDGSAWLSISDIGFAQFSAGQQKYFNTFSNPLPSSFPLPKCAAITVNRTHGHLPSIQKVQKYWPAQLESMEGAAFFHAMTRAQIPFYAFRTISNYVEKRNRDAWDIPLAVKNMQEWLIKKLQDGEFQIP